MKKFTISTSRVVLLVQLIAAHVLGTLFAYLVYANFTQLGDNYLPEHFVQFYKNHYNGEIATTIITHGVYYLLGFVFPGFLPAMFLGILIGIFIWVTFRDIYKYVNRTLFWISNLFPHFLIWSGASSKEQLLIIASLIVINFAAKRSFDKKELNFNFIFVIMALFFIYFMKPNYFIMYFIVFIMALFSPWLNINLSRTLSFGVWCLLLTLGVTLCIIFTSIFLSDEILNYMHQTQSQFYNYENARTNRYDIQWNDKFDFIYNSFWAIPQGFIGPTLPESILRPILFPVFLEGLLYLTILLYLLFKLLNLAIKSRDLRAHILIYIFGCFAIIFVSYPWLMFNPGSGLRYKQSIHPIMMFYPLLILAYYKANSLMKNDKKKISNKSK